MGQQLSKRLGQPLSGDFLAVDLQPLEEGLVEEPPFGWLSSAVGGLNVLGQGQGHLQGLQQGVVLDVQASDHLLGGDPLPPDPGLFLGEQRLGDLVGVVGSQQLALLPLQTSQLSASLPQLGVGQRSKPLQVMQHGLADALPSLLGELDRHVVPLNGLLHSLRPVVALRADTSLPSPAHEVVVDPPIALDPGEEQPSATLPARMSRSS